MRVPYHNASADSMLKAYGLYLQVRIQATSGLEDVIEYFDAVQADLQTRVDALDRAYRLRLAAAAMRDYSNDEMDQETRILAFTILGRVNNNRNAPIFDHYFPNGFAEVVNTPLAKQRRRSHVLLEKLEDETDVVVASRLEPFKVALEKLNDAIRTYDAALDNEASARAGLGAAKITWIAGYRRTYTMIKDHLSNDPSKAELFFRPVMKKKRTVPVGEDDEYGAETGGTGVEFGEDSDDGELSLVGSETESESGAGAGSGPGGGTDNSGADTQSGEESEVIDTIHD